GRSRPVFEREVAADLTHDLVPDRSDIRRKARHQRVVADDARQPGNAARVLVNGDDRVAREQLVGGAAGDPYAGGDVRGGGVQIEGRELAAQRDALLQLPEIWLIEPRGELRLPDERQRQRSTVHFGVRQQADFLEQLVRQALRLVDDEGDHAAAVGATGEK